MEIKCDIKTYGEQAILIQLLEENLSESNNQVISLLHHLNTKSFPFLIECIPSFNSITVLYEIQQINYHQLISILSNEVKNIIPHISSTKEIDLPICYDYEYALDHEFLEQATDMSFKDFTRLHLETKFKVFMTGFMPGFVYLGELPSNFDISRKESPRKSIPTGSVGLAGRYTGIYSTESPGGWQIIGQSISLLDTMANSSQSLSIGDSVNFYEVSKKELSSIRSKGLPL